MNGCHEELEQPVAEYAGEKFRRCPRSTVGADELHVLELAREGYLEDVGARETRKLPAKLVDAIRFVLSLKEKADG